MTVYYLQNPYLRSLLQGITLLLGLVLMQPLLAKDNSPRMTDPEAGNIRKLREAGNIMSLETLLKNIRQDYPGRIIEIELDKEDERYIYELEIVDAGGVVWELHFDAGTGELLERERED